MSDRSLSPDATSNPDAPGNPEMGAPDASVSPDAPVDTSDAPTNVDASVNGGLSVIPGSLDFGSQQQGVGGPAVAVTVTNGSASAVTVSSLVLAGTDAGDFTVKTDLCSGHALAAQSTCTVSLVFTPHGLGSRSATLSVAATDAGSPHGVVLAGTGVATAPAVGVSPAKIAFGLVLSGTSSPPTQVTVTNNGGAPVTIATTALSGAQAQDFVLAADACKGTTLAPAAICVVTVEFTPHQACKLEKATLTFTDDAATSPQTVELSGGGVAGTPGRFGSTLYCTSESAQPGRLAALTIGDVGFTEHGSRVSPAALATVNTTDGVKESTGGLLGSGWAPHDLTVAPDGTTAFFEENFANGNGLYIDLMSLGGGKSQYGSFGGVTGPIGAGPDGAFWIATDHACVGSTSPFVKRAAPGLAVVDFTLEPKWLQPNVGTTCATTSVMTAGPDGNVWLGLQPQNNGITPGSGFIRVTTSGIFADFIPTTAGGPLAATMGGDGKLYALIGGGNACRLSAFDAQGVETTALALAASSGMSCEALALGADGRLWRPATQYDNTGSTPALAAFDPKTAAVTFYPAPLSQYVTGGPDQGIWFNSGPSAVGRFDLGGGPARAFVQPTTLGFPTTAVGMTSPTRIVTVRSTGTGPLTISQISLGGANPAEFVLTADTCTGARVAPGSTCTVTAASKPTRTGSSTASLIVGSDDTFGPQTVNLATFTLPPPPKASPPQVSFATTQVGKHSGVIGITLTNPAEKSVRVSSVSTSGAGSSDFDIVTDNCGGTVLAAMGSCIVTLRFSPSQPGNRTAVLSFLDAATPATQTVALSGSGRPAPGGGGADAGASDAGPSDGGSGGACGCTGPFVDPRVIDPAGSPTSPHGLYTLEEVAGGVGHLVANIKVKTAGGATLIDYTPGLDTTWPTFAPWGFSPDDKRFVMHYQVIGNDWIDLYDLTSPTPATPVFSKNIPIAPGGSVTGPSGSVAFSPHGDYLVATEVQTPTGSLLQTEFLYLATANGSVQKTISWNPYRVPQGSVSDPTVDSAFWGFGPDDQSFTYLFLDANGIPNWTLLSPPTASTPLASLLLTNKVAAYVQYAPCGEAIAVVDQITDPQNVSPPNPVAISVYSTRAVSTLGSVSGLAAPDAGISLVADSVSYTAQSPDFSTIVTLAPNNAAVTCADH